MYTCKFSCLLEFRLFRYCSEEEEEAEEEAEEEEEHGNSVKISITCITPVLQAILDIISFQHVFHLGVGRSQIEWKLIQISVFP